MISAAVGVVKLVVARSIGHHIGIANGRAQEGKARREIRFTRREMGRMLA
jgi:hypothetical protein